jgi:hypothetical protein
MLSKANTRAVGVFLYASLTGRSSNDVFIHQ